MSLSYSIFDTRDPKELKDYKLWNRKLPGLKISDPIQITLQAAKKAKDGESFDFRPFYVTKNGFLYYKKTPETPKIRGAMDLKWARIIFSKVEAREVFESDFCYTVKIVKNLKFTTLYLRDKEDMEMWRDALLVHAAMTDFHEQYEVVDIIGKGAFAKVKFQNFNIFFSFKFKIFYS